MQMATPRRTLTALVSALALVAMGCSTGAQTGANVDGATVSVASPAEGATVSIPFGVQIDASVPLGETSTGNHHVHIYFDASTDSADYDIVYGATTQVTRQLAPGEHTLIVALANPDHSLAGPTHELHVTVSGEGGSGGGEMTPVPTSGGPY